MLEKFKETFYLRFEEFELERSLRPAEILASSRLYVRSEEKQVKVYYLHSSDQIIIPSPWINLFAGLDRMVGKMGEDKFLDLGTDLWKWWREGDLREMVKLGSGNLRRWFRTEFNVTFEPWRIRNIYEDLEI